MIWKQWTNEYLPQWNSRSKWYSKQEKNLSAGDLVWLVEDNMKRSHYQMARIIEVYPGKDGYVRSALIKTATGQCKRPVVKLACVLQRRVFSYGKQGRRCWRHTIIIQIEYFWFSVRHLKYLTYEGTPIRYLIRMFEASLYPIKIV